MANQTEIKKNPTWADLKAFTGTLMPWQLAQPITWWGDEKGGKVSSIDVLDVDFINDGEGYSPSTSFDAETLAELIEENEGVLVKGTPIVYVD